VKPLGKTLVDGEVLCVVSGFNHLAERLERLGCQRLKCQLLTR
jgi:hypothetical protein